MRQSIALFLLSVTAAAAQVVSYGIKGGVPVTDAERRSTGLWPSFVSYVSTGRLTIGPTIEFHLPARLSIEANALYRGFETGTGGMLQFGSDLNPLFFGTRRTVRAWDFPLLLKYRFPGERMQPFLSGGVSLTRESDDTSVAYTCQGPLPCYPQEMIPFAGGQFHDSRNRAGYVGATGAEFRLSRFRVAPEIRYTRLRDPGTNQVTILFGISF